MPVQDKNNHICPIEYTLSTIGGKWKILILYHISIGKVMRYGELKKRLNRITHKMLSQQLKDLEKDGLINRKEYHEIPPRVEYSLTKKGETLFPILEVMNKWGEKNL
ncbi:MAG TPA: transcriptional regulator [Clostridium sp.]|nr:transcriptional regulator [Clostridium sp.]